MYWKIIHFIPFFAVVYIFSASLKHTYGSNFLLYHPNLKTINHFLKIINYGGNLINYVLYVKPSICYAKERKLLLIEAVLLQSYTTMCYSELKITASLCFVIGI